MYHSQDCWRSEEDVSRQFAKTTGNTERVNAVKDQIIIREIGSGLNDVIISWSKNGRDFTGEELRDQFIDIDLFVEGDRDVTPDPKLNLTSRGEQTQLGIKSKYLDVLDNEREAKKDDFTITLADLREKMDLDGQTDRY